MIGYANLFNLLESAFNTYLCVCIFKDLHLHIDLILHEYCLSVRKSNQQ